MLLTVSNHTISLNDDYAVIVPHPNTEISETTIRNITRSIANTDFQPKSYIFHAHNHLHVSFCAMQHMMKLKKVNVGVVSGSARTRQIFYSLKYMSPGIEIFHNLKDAEDWLTIKNQPQN